MRTVTKTSIQELKLDKDGEIEGYYNPSSDILLYELLRSRLKEAGGNGKRHSLKALCINRHQMGALLQK